MDNTSHVRTRVRTRGPRRGRGILSRGGRGAGVPDPNPIPGSQRSVRSSQSPQPDDRVIADFPDGGPLETPLSFLRNRKRPWSPHPSTSAVVEASTSGLMAEGSASGLVDVNVAVVEAPPPFPEFPPSPAVTSHVRTRVRTRGPRRGRGISSRGGRGAGVPDPNPIPGSQRSVSSSQSPQTDDRAIADFPDGGPLETPLSFLRNRKRPWSPHPSTSAVVKASTSGLMAEGSASGLVDVNVTVVEAPPPFPEFSPSPAVFEECGTTTPASTPPSTPRVVRPMQPLQDSQIKLLFNYGSEPDDSEEEDIMPNPSTLRILRTLEDTPEDDDDMTIELISSIAAIAPSSSAAALSSPATDPSSSAVAFGPLNFDDFEWKSFPNPQILPDLRREVFSENNVGPTTPCVDPYDTFIAVWDRQFMEHIALETNRYAQQVAEQMLHSSNLHPNSRIASWYDTTADELYLFFALIIGMGIIVKSKVPKYWNATPDVFYTPGFSAHMALKRFQMLSKCLHFNNNENLSALERDSSEAKLFKIEPVVSHLNCKFQNMYNLSRNIAVDESLLQWKGLNFKQFISNKAASEGIKTYELCEPTTGYLWRFAIHAHKKSQKPVSTNPLDVFTSANVLKLIHGLENKGHTLWIDNYYNSPLLSRKLKTIGFDCVGTLRTNRQYVPESLAKLTKSMLKPGQITGLTSGDVDILVWRDKNRVATTSTYHGNYVARRDEAIKPIMVLDYNIMMGGLDKKDQRLSMFPTERKQTKVWYKRLFHRLLNVSVLNSYILCKQSLSSTSTHNHRSFRISLVKSLIKHHSSHSIHSLPVAPTQIRPVNAAKHYHPAKLHHPAKYRTAKRIRRNCVVCRTRVNTYCVGCNQAVCIFSSCFSSLHTDS